MDIRYGTDLVTHTLTPTIPAHAGTAGTGTLFGVSLVSMILYAIGVFALRHRSKAGGLSLALYCTLFGTICVTYPLVVVVGEVFDVAGTAGGQLFGVGTSKFLTIVGCLLIAELICVAWPTRVPWQPTNKEATYIHLGVAVVAPLLLALGYGGTVIYGISGWLNGIG